MPFQDSGSSTASDESLRFILRPVLLGAVAVGISACGSDGGPVEPKNQSPVAQLSVSPEQGYVGTTFQFDGSQSYDPDGSISSYNWIYGDGNSGSGMTTEHTYETEGNYEVCLTVTDNAGATNRACLDDEVLVERGEQIAFRMKIDGNDDIYVSHIDGSNVRRLTTDPGQDLDPAWSPDGENIAFTTTRDGRASIYIIRADGSHLRKLTPDANIDFITSIWSHNGQIYLSFIDRDENSNGIGRVNADGSGFEKIIEKLSTNTVIGRISLSPNGTRMFYSDYDGDWDIYSADVDGSDERKVIDTPNNELVPSVAPDGSRIDFVSNEFGGEHSGLELMFSNLDGSNIQRLTFTNEMEVDPNVSFDGNSLLFARWENEKWIIYVSDTNGANETSLDLQGSARYPAWRPRP